MTTELTLVLALLAAAIGMFAIGRPRADIVGVIMLVCLPLTGVITAREAVAVFGNPNIILIAAMFVIGAALARTGVAAGIGDWLARRGGKSPTRLVGLLMLAVGGLSSVMYSTGVIAIFIPVALRIARKVGMAPARILMPVAYAAIIGGTLTLVGASPNLVVNYELIRTGADGMEFFTLSPFGIAALALAILYMMVASRSLDGGTRAAPSGPPARRMGDLVAQYRLDERGLRARVPAESRAVGKTLSDLGLTAQQGWRMVAIERKAEEPRWLIELGPDTRLAANDTLLLERVAGDADIEATCAALGLRSLPLSELYFANRQQTIGMVEVLLPADSALIGKRASEAGATLENRLLAVGVRRGRTVLDAAEIEHATLQPGDIMLLVGRWTSIEMLRGRDADVVVVNMPEEFDEVHPAADRAPYAILSLLLTVGLIVFNILPAVHAALLGCLLMGLFRCIGIDTAYSAIQLRTLVLIAGMLPFGLALERTGGIDIASEALIGTFGAASPSLLLGLVFVMTVLLGLFVSAAANAILMAPLAFGIAEDLALSPYPFAITVALAASSTFITPLAAANAMAATLGGYRFTDFLRIGFPLVLTLMAISVFGVPLLYPFTP